MKQRLYALAALLVALDIFAAEAPAPVPSPAAPAVPAVGRGGDPALTPPGAPARGGFGRGQGGGAPQPPPPPPPIVLVPMPQSPTTLELLLPVGATATVDGKDAGAQRSFTFVEFDQTTFARRVPVKVKFADGTEVERAIDLMPAQRVRTAVNLPPVDNPSTIIMDSSVAVLGVAFSPDGRRVVTSAEDGDVVLWDLAAGRPVRNFPGHQKGVNAVAFSPNGEWLLTASGDATAALWQVETGRLLRRFKGHEAAVNAIAFSPDGKKVLTGSTDKLAILWDAETGAQIRTFKGHTDEVVAVTFSPDGATIATGSTDRYAGLWNVATGERLFSLRTGDTVSGVAFTPDGKCLAGSNFSNNTDLWDPATGKTVGSTVRVNLDLNGVAFLPDGRRFFTAGRDSTAKLWDTVTRQLVREFPAHGADVQTVAVSPDGRMLLTASRDGTARIFDSATGTELVSLVSSHAGKDWAVVAPDGLFDGTDSSRRIVGYRFSGKLPGASIDQFFGTHYHAGLLAEIFRGDRPMAQSQLGHRVPPLLKVIAPKVRAVPEREAVVVVDAVDQGGGVSAPKIFHNGARLPVVPEEAKNAGTVRYSFKVALAPGNNQFRVTAASGDGSWESLPVEVQFTATFKPERKPRLFVVAFDANETVGKAGANAPAGSRELVDLVRRRSGGLYDRVDVVSLRGAEVTRARMEEALRDVANLSQPQDTVVLLVNGRGALLGARWYFAPADLRADAAVAESDVRAKAIEAESLVTLLGSSHALNRALVFDLSEMTAPRFASPTSSFALRAAVEDWSRAQGVYAIAAFAPTPAKSAAAHPATSGLLSGWLVESAENGKNFRTGTKRGAGKTTIDVMEWFDAAVESAGPSLESAGADRPLVQQSTKAKSFPLLTLAK